MAETLIIKPQPGPDATTFLAPLQVDKLRLSYIAILTEHSHGNDQNHLYSYEVENSLIEIFLLVI